MENMTIWNNVKQPPKEALKQIGGGRLRGMTDINPQWRYHAATNQFGPCGIGWKIENIQHWTEPGLDGQVFAFMEVNFFYKTKEGIWSDPVPGTGGSMLIVKEKDGLHHNDEAFKMAETDATSVAMKKIGFGADVYACRWDGSKYKDAPEPPKAAPQRSAVPTEIIDVDGLDGSTVVDIIKSYQEALGYGPQQMRYFMDSFPELQGKMKLTLEEKRFLLGKLMEEKGAI